MRIQIAGSAALFYVVRNDSNNRTDNKMVPFMRRQVIRAIVNAMNNNLNEQTVSVVQFNSIIVDSKKKFPNIKIPITTPK